jgi:hypothetical protein
LESEYIISNENSFPQRRWWRKVKPNCFPLRLCAFAGYDVFTEHKTSDEEQTYAHK